VHQRVLYLLGIALELSGVASSTNRTAKPIEPNSPHIQSISPQSWTSLPPAKHTVPSSYPPSKRFLTAAQLQDNTQCSLASPLRRAGQPNNKMPLLKNVPQRRSQRRSHAPKWVCTHSRELFLLWWLLNEIPVTSDPPRPPPCRTNVCYCHPSIYCSGTSFQQ